MKDVRSVSETRSTLAKVMSFKDFVSLGLGTIIGVGWVIVAGDWLGRGGPLGVILAFLLGGGLLGIVGLAYAELTAALPIAGGATAFAYRAFGRKAAFLAGWFLSFAYITVCPFEAVAVGWLLEFLLPQGKAHILYTIGGYRVSLASVLAGVAITGLIAIMNWRGIKNAARIQTVSTGLMLACTVIFVIVALIKGSFRNMVPLFAGGGGVLAALGATLSVLGIVPFFMSGFDTIAQGAEESGGTMRPRDLGKAVILSIVVGALFYCLVIMALSVCLPWQESVSLELPTANAFGVAFGAEWAAKLVLVTALLGLITSFNGCFIAACRVLFAMGRGGLLPRWFGRVHPLHKTPYRAVLFIALITLFGLFAGKSSLTPIVNVGSLAYVCGWFMTCLSAVRLRQTAPDLPRPYNVRPRGLLLLGTLISGGLITLMILPGSSAQLAWPIEYLILAGWMALGFFGYQWRRMRKDMSEEERAYQILGGRLD
jgi:APA family basic amino acid/polyamine antiporter